MRVIIFLTAVFSAFGVYAQASVSDGLLTVKECNSFLKDHDFKNPTLDLITDVKITDSGKIKTVALFVTGVDVLTDSSGQSVKGNCEIHGWFNSDGTASEYPECIGHSCVCWNASCEFPNGKTLKK